MRLGLSRPGGGTLGQRLLTATCRHMAVGPARPARKGPASRLHRTLTILCVCVCVCDLGVLICISCTNGAREYWFTFASTAPIRTQGDGTYKTWGRLSLSFAHASSRMCIRWGPLRWQSQAGSFEERSQG